MKNFKIVNHFLQELLFEAYDTPVIFDEDSHTIKVDVAVEFEESEDQDGEFIVCLKYTFYAEVIDTEEDLLVITSTYIGVAAIEDLVDKYHEKKICSVDVPTLLFPFQKAIIEQTLTHGGFSLFRMEMVDFQDLYNKTLTSSILELNFDDGDDETDDDFDEEEDDEDNELFDFKQFVEDINNDLIGDDDLKEYEKACGKLPENSKDLPHYKNYFRFFKPIKYKIPEYLNFNDFNWDLLFQLLAGSISFDYKIEMEAGEQLPELIFKKDQPHSDNIPWEKWKKISDLSRSQVRDLIEDLLIAAMGESKTFYSQKITINSAFAKKLTNDRIPTWKEFLSIYKISEESEAVSMANVFYDKLKRYDFIFYQFIRQREIDEIFNVTLI
jgi:preprotein translocase subunit SecB